MQEAIALLPVDALKFHGALRVLVYGELMTGGMAVQALALICAALKRSAEGVGVREIMKCEGRDRVRSEDF